MAKLISKPEEFNALVATNIRMRRAALRISLRELGEATGISYTTLSKIENEEVDIRLGHVARIALALDIEPQELIGGGAA